MQALPALGAAVAGMSTATAVAAASAVVGGVSAYSQAKYQGQVASNNAVIADRNAERARHESSIESMDNDMQARAEMGAFMAQGGASGLALGVGSMGLQRKGLKELAARDRAYTKYAGEAKAAAYTQQGDDFRSEAEMQKSAAKFGLLESGLNLGGSLISGAPSVAPGTASRITGPTRPRARPRS